MVNQETKVERRARALAAAVHISSIFWPILGPLVGFGLWRKRDEFVSAHARKALLEAIWLKIGLFFAFAASTIYSISRIIHYVQTNWTDFSWQEFVIRFVLGWVALLVLEFVTIVVSIRQAYLAWSGHWPRGHRDQSPTPLPDVS